MLDNIKYIIFFPLLIGVVPCVKLLCHSVTAVTEQKMSPRHKYWKDVMKSVRKHLCSVWNLNPQPREWLVECYAPCGYKQ
jgi:hypothetical protein